MPKNGNDLTDSEWKIMEVLWGQSPRTMRQIEDALKSETGWTRHTVISFLKRMSAKGAVAVTEGDVKLYAPRIAREEAVRKETRDLLDRMYGSSALRLMSAMVEEKQLDDREIDELMAMLDAARREDEE